MSDDGEEEISEEDRQLFRKQVEQDLPVRLPRQQRPREKYRVSPVSLRSGRHNKRKSSAPEPDRTVFRRPGVQERQLNHVLRGKYQVAAELDLHGDYEADAMERLYNFLEQCISKGNRYVRIIHGRGRHSREGRPVLKKAVEDWLRKKPEVLVFCNPQRHEGGSGVLDLCLRLRGR